MKIQAILVLYERGLGESETYRSLTRSVLAGACAESVDVLVYDNTANPRPKPESTDLPYTYIHNPQNGGIAAAYNAALYMTSLNKAEWLLLLDQDTRLPKEFMARLLAVLECVSGDSQVVSVVPQVRQGECPVSPSLVKMGWRLKPIEVHVTGIVDKRVTAINSGASIRCSFLRELGGFDQRFPIDYLDHWLFQKINVCSRRIYIFDQIIDHNLSINDFAIKITLARYRSILAGEFLFYSQILSAPEYSVYLIRLLVRYIRQSLSISLRPYRHETLEQLRRSTFGWGSNRGI